VAKRTHAPRRTVLRTHECAPVDKRTLVLSKTADATKHALRSRCGAAGQELLLKPGKFVGEGNFSFVMLHGPHAVRWTEYTTHAVGQYDLHRLLGKESKNHIAQVHRRVFCHCPGVLDPSVPMVMMGFVMPYYPFDLKKAVRTFDLAVLSEPLILKWLRQIQSAIGVWHARRHVHNDLKMANVLLTDRPYDAVVSDFGGMVPINQTVHEMTPNVSAPETAKGQPAHPSNDVFGFMNIVQSILRNLAKRKVPVDTAYPELKRIAKHLAAHWTDVDAFHRDLKIPAPHPKPDHKTRKKKGGVRTHPKRDCSSRKKKGGEQRKHPHKTKRHRHGSKKKSALPRATTTLRQSLKRKCKKRKKAVYVT
jgi:serine/threonine protein kinase